MLKHILVATDFSPAAERAVARAGLICRSSGSQLTVLHVLPERALLDRIFHRDEIDYEAMVSGAAHALRNTLNDLDRRYGVKAGSAVVNGAAHRMIAAAATADKADLLVMGTLGERESRAAQGLGGTALKCVLETTVPLLLVRRPVQGEYCKILAAVDDSKTARSVLAWALAVSDGESACEVLHAFDVPFAQRLRAQNVKEATIEAYATRERERWANELMALTDELGASGRVRPIVVRGGSVSAVTEEIRSRQPDLVVVGKRDRYTVTDLANIDSVSLDVVLNGSGDVLLVP